LILLEIRRTGARMASWFRGPCARPGHGLRLARDKVAATIRSRPDLSETVGGS
jgi:hypothetical protein